MIFTGADASGFEEDARLTAMWLWTLKTGDANGADGQATDDESGGDEDAGGKKGGGGGFVLEFDAARKIAQGLGAHLENLATLVAVEGETARLLPVAERARPLFGKDEGKATPIRKKRGPQMELFKATQEGRRRQTGLWRSQGREGWRNRARPRPPKHDSLRRRPQRSPQTLPRR